MKRILILLIIGFLIVSCSSPQERADAVKDYDNIIWRSNPTTFHVHESFLCKDKYKRLWYIRVSDGGNIITISKINGYILIQDNDE